MKIFISADIEGITGVTHWDETDLEKDVFAAARQQMTAEVAAACEGALEAGTTEIWVKDAHDSARNLDAASLPRQVRLVRGWAPDPMMMLQELDESFQAALFIGYHSRAGSGASPLAHTMSGAYVRLTLNGRPASEFLLGALTAALCQVPVAFVSGDEGLCAEVSEWNPSIGTLAVKRGVGDSTISLHPGLAVDLLREGVTRALQGDYSLCKVPLPQAFTLDIHYRKHVEAYRAGFYPGVQRLDPVTLRFEHRDFYEVLRFLLFAS